MNLAGFQLTRFLEVLRCVGAMEKYSQGFLPSKAQIMQCARELEAYAEDFCPFQMVGRSLTMILVIQTMITLLGRALSLMQ
jgi:hypothetical protein